MRARPRRWSARGGRCSAEVRGDTAICLALQPFRIRLRVVPWDEGGAEHGAVEFTLGRIRTGARVFEPNRRSALLLGLALGVAIWLLSPFITGHREPWDAEGGYYASALLVAGMLGGLVVPQHWASSAIGILAGQAVVLMGGVIAEPARGGLWPLGLGFLALYSVLGLVGAAVGTGLRRLWSRGQGSRGG